MISNSVSFMFPAVNTLRAIFNAGVMFWLGSSIATAQQTSSSPIAITSDDRFVWSVNPDNNSVSVCDVLNAANVRRDSCRQGAAPARDPTKRQPRICHEYGW